MTIVLIAILAYSVATGLQIRTAIQQNPRISMAWLAAACIALLAHGWVHLASWMVHGATNMHFFAALSLVGLGMTLVTLLFSFRRNLSTLSVIVFPIAALSLLGYATSDIQNAGPDMAPELQVHAWCALLAYATLAIAALLAIMLSIQERALRQRTFNTLTTILPPLTELETLLFRTIAVGFVLLTATLMTGFLFVDDLFAQHVVHKTVLSILSWLVFGMLLFGRWRYGWRGKKAVRLTLIAMTLLVLAYFGSKFVQELILQRP